MTAKNITIGIGIGLLVFGILMLVFAGPGTVLSTAAKWLTGGGVIVSVIGLFLKG